MRRWGIVGFVLVLGMVGIGSALWAQEEGGWGHGFRDRGEGRVGERLLAMLESDRVKAALGLTDQQSDRFRQITVEAEKATVKTRAEMAVRGIELRELLRADKPDREVVMKKVQEISDLRRDMMRQHVDALLAAKTVLTPEQQKKIRALIASRRAGFGRGGFRPHGPGAPGRPGAPPEPPHNPDEPSVQ